MNNLEIKPFFAPPEYHTDTSMLRRPWFYRLLPLAGPAFYLSMAYSILVARRRAAQGRLDLREWGAISVMCGKMAEWCGGRLHLTGLDQLYAQPGAAVIIGNHMSTLETFLLPGIILPAKPLAFVVKESLQRHPFFGPVMRATPAIAVSRHNPREDLKAVLEGGTEKLQAGYSMCIFPQSTRCYEFHEDKFNTLGVKLARRAGVQVIPMAVKTNFWSNGKWLKDMGPIRPEHEVHIAFGPPLSPDLPQAELHGRVVAFVRDHLQSWGVPCSQSSAPATQ